MGLLHQAIEKPLIAALDSNLLAPSSVGFEF